MLFSCGFVVVVCMRNKELRNKEEDIIALNVVIDNYTKISLWIAAGTEMRTLYSLQMIA